MRQHTEGPWRLVETGDGELWLLAGADTEIGDPTSYFICNLDEWDDELVSNGRLMRVAPKLLALAHYGIRVDLSDPESANDFQNELGKILNIYYGG